MRLKRVGLVVCLALSFIVLFGCENKQKDVTNTKTSTSVPSDDSKTQTLKIKLEQSQFEAYPGDKIVYKGTTEPNAEIGLGDNFDHKSDDKGYFEFEYLVPELHTTGITNPVNVRKGDLTGNNGSHIKVLKREEAEREVVPEENLKALSKANGYNNSVPMSKREMFEQLTIQENFTDEQAQYAIDNMSADWKQNALKTAKIYKYDMNMSNDEIKEQLTADSGNKYTEEEADFAISNLK